MVVNANEENYEKLEILGQTVLFTNMRIGRSTVPEGLHAYDLRHDDDGQGDICEIKPFVMVNHWGTILAKEPIPMSDGECRFVNDEDYSYTGENCTLSEFLAEDSGQEESEELEVEMT